MYSNQTRKSIKSTLSIGDGKKKREEKQKSLRKKNKYQTLNKRRKEEVVELTAQLEHQVQQIPLIVEQIANHNQDFLVLLNSIETLRKMLAVESNPPIDQVANSGIVPVLIHFLQQSDPQIQQLHHSATWVLSILASGSGNTVKILLAAKTVQTLIHLIKQNHTRDDTLGHCFWTLANLSAENSSSRNFILSMGIVPLLIEMLNSGKISNNVETLRIAVWLMQNLCRGKPSANFDEIAPLLSVFVGLLDCKDEVTFVDACWSISHIVEYQYNGSKIINELGVIGKLIQLLGQNFRNLKIATPLFRIVGNITAGTDAEAQVAVDNGLVHCLHSILSNNPPKSMQKEACWILSNLMTGSDSQRGMLFSMGFIPILISVLKGRDLCSKTDAFVALCNGAMKGTRNEIVQIVKSGFIPQLMLFLKGKDCSSIITGLNALVFILECGDEIADELGHGLNKYCDQVEEEDGIEILENLQQHSNSEIYLLSLELLETYFGFDYHDYDSFEEDFDDSDHSDEDEPPVVFSFKK